MELEQEQQTRQTNRETADTVGDAAQGTTPVDAETSEATTETIETTGTGEEKTAKTATDTAASATQAGTPETEESMEERTRALLGDMKRGTGRLGQYLKQVFNIRDNMMSYEDIDKMMQEQTVIHGANMWILMFAILIASIGLNVNSTAVIIGAMLISPLMNGIVAMGYALATRNLGMLRKALLRFLTQVIISLVTATLYFKISPLSEPTAEMIARTSPTIWDVLIAIFGGMAGMIGNTRTKSSNVIPGVAIATALMPPLCTAGYGIASGQVSFFLGAFTLFLINTVFIAISSSAVTLVLRVPPHKEANLKRQHIVNGVVAAVAISLIVPSVWSAVASVRSSVVEHNFNNYMDTEFQFANSQVVKSSIDMEKKEVSVSMIGALLSDDVLELLESQLPSYDLEDYTLHVTQNVPLDGETNDKVTILVQENTISELQDRVAEQSAYIQEMESSLQEYEGKIGAYRDMKSLSDQAGEIFPHLTDCHAGLLFENGEEFIVLIASTDTEISEEDQGIIRRWLSAESGIPRAELYLIDGQ